MRITPEELYRRAVLIESDLESLKSQLGWDPRTGLIDQAIFTSSARWSLFEDSNASAFTGIASTSPELLALMPVFDYIGTRGQWVGWFTVRAAVTGTGRARARLYDYIASAFISECSWSFDFDDSVSDVLVMNGHHSLKSQSGSTRIGLVVDRESGTGSFDVGVDDGKLSVLVVGQTGSASEPDPGSELFSYTGAAQTFTVPTNVFEITVTAKGAAGNGSGGPGQGAKGGLIQCSVPVVPGQVLQVNVGGKGSGATGGWNGGGTGSTDPGPPTVARGGGGGMSDVRAYPYAVTDARVVAGGGGGNDGGGTGGYTDGAAGGGTGSLGGGGGSQSAGGAAGTGDVNGNAGTQGQGGNSASYGGSKWPGGGGGGWYGGGGGGRNVFVAAEGHGGGGSSYYASSSGVVLISETDGGGDASDGSVLIEW